jgi:hypothetical protein
MNPVHFALMNHANCHPADFVGCPLAGANDRDLPSLIRRLLGCRHCGRRSAGATRHMRGACDHTKSGGAVRFRRWAAAARYPVTCLHAVLMKPCSSSPDRHLV